MKPKSIGGTVIVFGFVSFLTDVSSDMVYPLLPLFLTTQIGASVAFVGLVEGFAESTAAFFMLGAGVWADRIKDRTRLVLGGYGLSAVTKPLMALARSSWAVLWVRFFDRVGKGVRGSPRDALIADAVDPALRGRAYGFHRSMDNAGAVLGPILAAVLLATWVSDLRTLFWIAAIPGFFAVALIAWKVREVSDTQRTRRVGEPFRFKAPEGKLRVFLVILSVFILSCSSDAFLLLRATELGVSKKLLPILWMIFNLVKALLTYPLGSLSDKIGRRRIILTGWVIYAVVYFCFAYARETWQAWALFAAYGLFYAFTEGSERAFLADTADPSDRGQAFGWYYFIVGMGSLPASLLFGALWQIGGSRLAFTVSGVISSVAIVALGIFLLRSPSFRKSV